MQRGINGSSHGDPAPALCSAQFASEGECQSDAEMRRPHSAPLSQHWRCVSGLLGRRSSWQRRRWIYHQRWGLRFVVVDLLYKLLAWNGLLQLHFELPTVFERNFLVKNNECPLYAGFISCSTALSGQIRHFVFLFRSFFTLASNFEIEAER